MVVLIVAGANEIGGAVDRVQEEAHVEGRDPVRLKGMGECEGAAGRGGDGNTGMAKLERWKGREDDGGGGEGGRKCV